MWQGRSASAINLLFPKPSRDTLRLMVCARCALLARMRKVCSSDIGLPDGLKSSFSRKPPKMHPSSDSCAVPDYAALAYWACLALELGPDLPLDVACELKQRCPGCVESWLNDKATASQFATQVWDGLMLWIGPACYSNDGIC